jgi:hypothetical protein
MKILGLREAFSGLMSFVLVFSVFSGTGCGTDAQAVDECRDIEEARCEASKPCGLVDDVDECKRFFRDHCLHGMVVKSPGQAAVDQCVNMIQNAGTCAAGDPDTALSDCTDVTVASAGATTACDLVLYPERASECSFLAPDQTIPTGSGAGGTGGSEDDADAGEDYAKKDSGAAGASEGG